MKKYGLAAFLVATAACLSIVLRPMLTNFPALTPLLFLGAIAIVARYVDFVASIFALSVSAALLEVFFFPSPPRHPLLGVALVKTICFIAVSASICALIRKLRNARAGRARLAAIVDFSNDAIVSEDLDGIVTSWNAAAVRMFGYTADEMIGQPIQWIVPLEFHDQVDMTLSNIRKGKGLNHVETERIRKDRSRIKVSLTISPLISAEGRVEGASKIFRDITERVRMQEAFIESEKLAATGRMAAAIAHEINNPLEAVTNLAFLLNHNESLDSSARQCAKLLMEEISRVSNVAKRSLTFFRDTGKPAEFDAAAAMDSVLELNNPLFAQKRISARRNYTGPSVVFGSSAEMRQVFSNLIRNAIDAIGSDGQIEVRIRAARNGNWRISVADNGQGIQSETRERLFEPFVTTKGNTGNGLGLWISRGIVENHGGQIRARSALIGGKSWTVFVVVLPASKAAPMNKSESVAKVS